MQDIREDTDEHIALEDDRVDIEELIGIYFGRDGGAEYYTEQFNYFVVNGYLQFDLTWNWFALFLGPFYYLYRKMYLCAVIFGILMLPFLPMYLFFAPLSATLANYLYIRQFYKAVKKADDESDSYDDFVNRLYYKGEANIPLVLIIAVLLILLLCAGRLL